MYLAYTCYIQTVNSYGELSPQVTLKLEEWLDISENQVTESLLTQSDIMWMSAKWIWAVFFLYHICVFTHLLWGPLYFWTETDLCDLVLGFYFLFTELVSRKLKQLHLLLR